MSCLKKSTFLTSSRFILRAYWRRTCPSVFFWKNSFSPCNQITVSFLVQKGRKRSNMGLLKGATAFFNHCFYCNVSTSESRPSLSLIFLDRPLLQERNLSTWERWLLVLSHIRITDDLEISHSRAISPSDSPVFSLRIQTLARCWAEIFPVYTITYCEAVYSLKYCAAGSWPVATTKKSAVDLNFGVKDGIFVSTGQVPARSKWPA